MHITDKHLAFVAFPVVCPCRHDASRLFFEGYDPRTAMDFASVCPDSPRQCLGQHGAVACQAPRALDEGTVAVGKGKQGQTFLAEFHFQRGSAEDVA